MTVFFLTQLGNMLFLKSKKCTVACFLVATKMKQENNTFLVSPKFN